MSNTFILVLHRICLCHSCGVTHEIRLHFLEMLLQAGQAGPYLFVWMRAVVAEHQVGSPAVEQQVCRLEGQGEALDTLAEVKGVPQVVVGGVDKKILKNERIHN